MIAEYLLWIGLCLFVGVAVGLLAHNAGVGVGAAGVVLLIASVRGSRL